MDGEPTCREFSCWLARKSGGVVGRGPGFCPTVEVESGVSHHLTVQSPLNSPQYQSNLCFRDPLRLQKLEVSFS